MARKPRIEFHGAFYHVLTRGNQRQDIFKDLTDHHKYLQILGSYKERYGYLLYAYVLMKNHVHLLIETQETPLSKILQGINQRYTMYFNRKYRTVGHLFQGRCKVILCDRDAYLLVLTKYIHYNPIRAKITKTLQGYPWSSHHAYFPKTNPEGLVDTDFVLGLFSTRKDEAQRRYLRFMVEGEEAKGEDIYATVDQRILGSEEFTENILKKYGDGAEGTITKKAYSLSQIATAVERLHGLRINDLRSSAKPRQISFGRRLFSLGAREYGHKGYEIAGYLRKDPAVVTVYARVNDELTAGVKELKRYLDENKSQ